ncbi:MAG: response regulator [Ignavibacteriales bacterium]|nr:MAG: response regulator [Ignavibacteriales bacterium]
MDSKFILLIEDNKDDIELTIRAFQKNNLKNEIVVIKDGGEAMDYFDKLAEVQPNENPKLPTLILLDLKLPKADGIDILKKIRSIPLTKFTPVVILTSSLEEQDLFNGYQFGANSYIRKPVDFNKFLNAVQQLGLYWLLLNETPKKAG